MKKNFLILTILLLAAICAVKAQSLQSVHVDTLSGDTSKILNIQQLYGDPANIGTASNQVTYQLTRMGAIYFISLNIQTGSLTPFAVDPGKTLNITLNDSTTVTCINTQPVSSQFSTVNYGYSMTINYLILKPDFIRLSGTPIDDIKMNYNAGIFDFNITDDNANTFLNAAILVL